MIWTLAINAFTQVAVAVAHRLARLIWILLSRQEHYQAMPNIEGNA